MTVPQIRHQSDSRAAWRMRAAAHHIEELLDDALWSTVTMPQFL